MSDTPLGPGWWQASDGRWYPPEQHPSYRSAPPLPPPMMPPPTPPPQQGMNGCLKAFLIVAAVGFVGLVGLGIVVAFVADDVAEEMDRREASISDDVELVGCEPQSSPGWMAGQLRITNDSSERSNYMIEVAFTSKSGTEQYDTGTAFVNGLQPGQSRSEEVSSFTEPPAGGYRCEVLDVTRFTDERP